MTTTNGNGAPRDLAGRHIDQLIEQGFEVYKIFHLLENEPASGDFEHIKDIFTKIAEIDVFEELKQGDAIFKTCKSLLGKDKEIRLHLFNAWLNCVEETRNNRKLVKSLLPGFAETMDDLGVTKGDPGVKRIKYLEFLPVLFKFYSRHALKLMPGVLDTLNKKIPGEYLERFLGFLEAFAPNVSHKIFDQVTGVAAFIVTNGLEFEEKFEEKFSWDEADESLDANKFFKSLHSALDTFPVKHRAVFVKLVVLIAAESFSSAHFVTTKLEKKWEGVGEKNKREYLDYFTRLMENPGIAMIDFCLNDLPGYYASKDIKKVREYMDTMLAISAQYGPSAGFYFSRGKTDAGKMLHH